MKNSALQSDGWVGSSRVTMSLRAANSALEYFLSVGRSFATVSGDLVFQLPTVPAEWQFLLDIIPAQLAAERLAWLAGVDCDSFRLCSYVVEDDYGLLHDEVAVQKDEK